MESRLASTIAAFDEVSRNRDLRRVGLAFAGFNLAEHGSWVAMLVYAFDAGGTRATGLIGFVQLLIAGMLAPVAASFGDRFRRDRALLGSYLI
jgi:hypothetical protein